MNGVYCLTFPNGKRYVGIGFRRCKYKFGMGIERRWNDYKNLRCKSQPKLYNALKKYGPENIKFEVVLQTEDYERAGKVEQQLIALWGLQNDKFGYNITVGGKSGWLGIKHKKETIEKISITKKIVSANPEYRKKISESKKGQGLKQREIIDTTTGKTFIINNLPQFCKENNLLEDSFRGGLNSIGKHKNWILVDHPRWK